MIHYRYLMLDANQTIHTRHNAVLTRVCRENPNASTLLFLRNVFVLPDNFLLH